MNLKNKEKDYGHSGIEMKVFESDDVKESAQKIYDALHKFEHTRNSHVAYVFEKEFEGLFKK